MKNLSSRVISAVIALIVLVLAVYYAREKGIYAIILFVVVRGSFEIARLFFDSTFPRFTRTFFLVVATTIYLLVSQESFRFLAGISLIVSFVLFAAVGIVSHKSFKNLDAVLVFIAKSCLGLIYTSLLPASVYWILQTNNGMEWFFCLLAVVFAGDIGAYISGINFGTIKLAPAISPNKSLQGSVGGLIFSTAIAGCFTFLLPNTPILVLLICGLLGGILGQIGDFFESLTKRVSGVKDSGTIMPGHGGVLDRLDGVLLAAPLFYIAATYFSL